MAMTQMNTRIDSSVKRAGDAVFASLGLSPSEVVRAAWEYAAEHGDAPAIVGNALRVGSAHASSVEKSYKLALGCAASDFVADYRRQRGASAPDSLELIDYDALRSEAWAEKLAERGLS